MSDAPQKSTLPIKVVPSSSQDCIAGWLGEVLKIRVRAPAERGRANEAAEKVLTRALGAPARIVAGRTSARKTVEIAGMSEADVRRRLPRTGS